ncbi:MULTISPECIES: NAD(P)/FAD-dependent oxidoreductase [Salinibaculum]|uniref:NAD(P)/FAD-dependent oxidoreductase n=1 Tax=Salinibaculum TaxID=2732368 RepID=UPI0030D59F35
MTDVAVVGGGLAGLVAARTLADRGEDVTVFERNPDVGGRVRSRQVDGFTLDRGFQVMFTAYPAVRRELDLDALDLGYFTPGATLTRPGERSTLSDPLRDPSALSASLFNREVSTLDKLRVLKLRRDLTGQSVDAALRNDTESIEDFLAGRGFSERFRRNFAAPFYGGITLDRSLSTSRAVFEYTFKMLSEGKTAVPADGMGAIPAQLAANARDAGATVEADTTVEAVEPDDGGVEVTTGTETVTADAAVVATDPPTARELTGVESIPTEARSCVTQHFALPETQRLDTGRRLLLNAANDRPNTVAPMSAAAPSYAPDDMQLLSATFLGQQDASDEALAGEVRDALASWYPENQFSNLELLATDRIDFAQFAQPPGFRAGLPAVDDPEGPVYLAGDYTRWSSIQGAMESGRDAALAVEKALS